MPNYRRAIQPGGTFFLTLVTHQRVSILTTDAARPLLHRAIAQTRHERPFDLIASVLLPDHLHVIIRLPDQDTDFATRVAAVKARFTRRWLESGGAETVQSIARERQEYRGVWQKRYWEHTVRDAEDLRHCVEYIHYNPVKHGLVPCPHAWQWSSFAQYVGRAQCDPTWSCSCNGAPYTSPPPDVSGAEME